MRLRRAAALVLAIATAGASLDARGADDDLTGTWIAIHGIDGEVIGNIEEVRIAKDGRATVEIHYVNDNPPCDGSRYRLSEDCRRPSPHASGTLTLDVSKRQLTLVGSIASKPVMPEPDGSLGPKFWMKPGAIYSFERAGTRLQIRDMASPSADPAPHPRLTAWPTTAYFEADPNFATELMDYVTESGVSNLTLACLLPIAHADPSNIAPLRDLVRDISRIGRYLADLRARAMLLPGGDPTGEIPETLRKFHSLEPGVPSHQTDIERFAATIGVSSRNLEILLRVGKGPRTRLPALPADFKGRDELVSCIDALLR